MTATLPTLDTTFVNIIVTQKLLSVFIVYHFVFISTQYIMMIVRFY